MSVSVVSSEVMPKMIYFYSNVGMITRALNKVKWFNIVESISFSIVEYCVLSV